MVMSGRSFTSDAYRYGFNGKEQDKEGMGGGGSTYDYGFRIYNSGIAKFLSVDPLTASYPWYTPYQFAGNKPIAFIDLDGLEDYYYLLQWDDKGGNPQLTFQKEVPDVIPGFFSSVYVNGHYIGDKVTCDGAKEMAQYYGTYSKKDFDQMLEMKKRDIEELNAKMEERSAEYSGAVVAAYAATTPKGTYTETATKKAFGKESTSNTHEKISSKGIIKNVDDFISKQTVRLYEKLGTKIGKGELQYPKGKEGVLQAVESVRTTLSNPTQTTGIIPKSVVRGDYDLIHIYSSESGNTVSLRVLGDGEYEFDTLIPGKSGKIKP